MTVEELMKHLNRLPADTPVLVEGYENGYDEIIELREMEIFKYRAAQEWDGEYQMTTAHPGFQGKEPFPAVVIQGRRGRLR